MGTMEDTSGHQTEAIVGEDGEGREANEGCVYYEMELAVGNMSEDDMRGCDRKEASNRSRNGWFVRDLVHSM